MLENLNNCTVNILAIMRSMKACSTTLRKREQIKEQEKKPKNPEPIDIPTQDERRTYC